MLLVVRLLIEKLVKEAEKENIDLSKATAEQVKELSEKVIENDQVKDLPNVDREIFREKIESDKAFLKELAEHKKGRAQAMKDLNEQLLQELGIDFAALVDAQKSSDIVDPIAINRSLEGLYKEIKNDPRYEGYSRADLKRMLLKSVYDAESYTICKRF